MPTTPFRPGASGWIFLLCLAGFAGTAAAVDTEFVRGLDESVLRALRDSDNPEDPLGPRWLEEAVRDVTALGSYTVLTFLTVGSVLILLRLRRYSDVALLLTASVGVALVNSLIKALVARERPELVPHLARVESLSFPSGHTMAATCIYFAVAELIARNAQRYSIKVYAYAFAAVLSLLVGASRVYLGVHYPTDVIAGWFAGGAWAVVALWVGSLDVWGGRAIGDPGVGTNSGSAPPPGTPPAGVAPG
ncbi:MAG TPA: phosphatase PAP2 family protein [Gemmataceae bacterium]